MFQKNIEMKKKIRVNGTCSQEVEFCEEYLFY